MLSKVLAFVTVLIAGSTVSAAYTQRAAFYLRQEDQRNHWPRHGTRTSGRYRRGTWIGSPYRQNYGQFRGGGPSSGK